jgi:hypothetical protein
VTKQEHVAKVVLGHDWTNLEDWVKALDELAELSDEQIDRLETPTPGGGGAPK